jgi:hypothetical protein
MGTDEVWIYRYYQSIRQKVLVATQKQITPNYNTYPYFSDTLQLADLCQIDLKYNKMSLLLTPVLTV